jgi:very-short-patch-repair endonuclease
VRGQVQSLPTWYKVDIADPTIKLAIEVDGQTHRLKKWKFLDRRKESVLRALGWSVLRFSNQQVMEDLEEVLAEIERFMISKSQTTTTSSPTGC